MTRAPKFSGELDTAPPRKNRLITVYITKWWETRGIIEATARLINSNGITYAMQSRDCEEHFYCRMGTGAHSTRRKAREFAVAQAGSRVDSLRKRADKIERAWCK